MEKSGRIKAGILAEAITIAIILCVAAGRNYMYSRTVPTIENESENGKDYIKWVDFNVTYEALCKAYDWDVDTYGKKVHINWIELLALEASKTGGEFGESAVADMDELAGELADGTTTVKKEADGLKYYSYYHDAYTAVLGGFVGKYRIEEPKEDGSVKYVEKYGLKAFSPIAKGFEYRDYDDFGVSRSYGFKREHLGHDMMGQIGTPIKIKY